MRAVIYARYSSDQQREASIEDQVRLCRERIDREGWSFLATYSDAAMSGASRLRPGYQKLLEDARASQFDLVVAEALDRISRDQEDIAGFYKQLGFCGIKLVTLAEGEISELHVGLKGTMNALFLKDLAAKTRRGLRGRVEQGRSGGGLCYGYDLVREVDAQGQLTAGGRKISDAEAAIVRRIFKEYAVGRSPRQIAFQLNAERIPGPHGGTWGQSTINGNAARGTGILNNELYVGRLVWNRLRYIKDPGTGKRVSRLNPEAEWVTRDVPDLRLIEIELWDDVKARQAGAHRATSPGASAVGFWDRRRPRYLFSGLMTCGACGGGYSKISANLFGCSTARNKGTCTNRINIRTDVLEATILDGLRHRLMDPALFKEFAEEFVREVNRLRGLEAGKADRVRTELATVERRLRKLVDAVAEGVPARSLKEELLALERRQDELRAELAAIRQPQPLLHPNLADLYRQKVTKLHEALNDEATKAEAADIIRSLVDEIRLTPEGGELRVDLKGALAGILALAADSKKPATRGDGLDSFAEQLKLVAGMRNHRQLMISV